MPESASGAFSGMALVVVRGKPGTAGKIRLTAESAGLQGAPVTIESVAGRLR